MEPLMMVWVGLNREFVEIRRRLYLMALGIACQTVFYLTWMRAFQVGTEQTRFLLYILWTLAGMIIIPPVWLTAAELKTGSIQHQLVIPRWPAAVVVGRTLAVSIAAVGYVSVLMPVLLLLSGVTLSMSGGVYVVVGCVAVGCWGVALAVCALVMWWRPSRYLSIVLLFMTIYFTSGLGKQVGLVWVWLELLPVLKPIKLLTMVTTGQLTWWQVGLQRLYLVIMIRSAVWVLIGIVMMHVTITCLNKLGGWPKGRFRLPEN